jgi:HSP20 family protein
LTAGAPVQIDAPCPEVGRQIRGNPADPLPKPPGGEEDPDLASFTLTRPLARNPWFGLVDELQRDLHSALRARDGVYQGTRGVYPLVNLFENEEGYVLTAELPGVAPEHINVSIEGSTVTLTGERKIEYPVGPSRDEKGTAIHRRERQAGSFRRAFELPAEIDIEKARASHKNGVLTLTLPKSAAAKPRQIAIETR